MCRRAFLVTIFLALVIGVPLHAQKVAGTGTLSGIVHKVDGTPQAGARVYLQRGDGHTSHTVLSDEHGHFHFDNVRVALYDVRAQANGEWSDLHRNINVRANQDVEVELQLKVTEPKKPANP